MAIIVKVSPIVRRKLANWKLDDDLLMDVYLFLDEVKKDPSSYLIRLTTPFDGLSTVFHQVDPHNRFREYWFFFHTFFSQNEEELILENAVFMQRTL